MEAGRWQRYRDTTARTLQALGRPIKDKKVSKTQLSNHRQDEIPHEYLFLYPFHPIHRTPYLRQNREKEGPDLEIPFQAPKPHQTPLQNQCMTDDQQTRKPLPPEAKIPLRAPSHHHLPHIIRQILKMILLIPDHPQQIQHPTPRVLALAPHLIDKVLRQRLQKSLVGPMTLGASASSAARRGSESGFSFSCSKRSESSQRKSSLVSVFQK